MDGPLENQGYEYEYKKKDKHVTEQFINGINDNMMTTEIIKQLTTMRKNNHVTSEKVLMYA